MRPIHCHYDKIEEGNKFNVFEIYALLFKTRPSFSNFGKNKLYANNKVKVIMYPGTATSNCTVLACTVHTVLPVLAGSLAGAGPNRQILFNFSPAPGKALWMGRETSSITASQPALLAFHLQYRSMIHTVQAIVLSSS